MKSDFPDCTLHHMEQRTPEWFAIRKGILTASEFGPYLMAEPKVNMTIEEIKAELDRLGKTYPNKGKKEDYVAILPNVESYKTLTKTEAEAIEAKVCRLLAQNAGCWEPTVRPNEAMERGTELEPEAVADFESATGLKIRPVGFARSLHGLFGCSPDGLIVGETCGLEGKCPVPSTHLQYRRAGVLPDEYRFQVHGCMAVTGAKSWWFQSYSPGLAPLRLLVERDQFTEDLLAGLIRFSGLVETAWEEEREAFARDMERRAA